MGPGKLDLFGLRVKLPGEGSFPNIPSAKQATATTNSTLHMCQVIAATKKRSHSADVSAVTKRAKQIVIDDEVTQKMPASPSDVAATLEEAEASTSSSFELDDDEEDMKRPVLQSNDLNLEVKLMQGAVNDMQATVNLASTRISELRQLLTQYAKNR